MAEVVGEGNSQWKEETRPRYGSWSRPVMSDGGVWCGRRGGESACVFQGRERRQERLAGTRGAQMAVEELGLESYNLG